MVHKTLKELSTHPDMKMDQQREQKMLNNLLDEEKHGSGSKAFFRRINAIGKGAAVCCLLLDAFWLGATFIYANHEASSTPAVTQPDNVPSSPNGVALANSHGSKKELLRTIKELSTQGKVINTPYSVETTVFDKVQKQWGEPNRSEMIYGLTYATYNQQKVVFGYNKGMQIVDIHSYDDRLHELSLTDVQQSLGAPEITNHFAGQLIYVYNISPKYQLKITFPAPTKETPNPHVDHINVFYPQGIKNLMLYGSDEELLQTVKQLAKSGKAFSSDFAVETSVYDNIEAQWGKPEQSDYVNGVTYASYRDRGIVIGYNKGMQVVEIRSYDPRLQALTLSSVTRALGKPNNIVTTSNELIYTYNVNNKYQLKVVFPAPTKKVPDPHVDHMNVVYPQGITNIMAQ